MSYVMSKLNIRRYVTRVTFLLFYALLSLIAAPTIPLPASTARVAWLDTALPGQIIIDPANLRWLFYNRDTNGDGKLDPFFWAGPGGPEDFFYRGVRNADGTRSGDQMDIINAIGASGANSLYVQTVRTHGGDGDSTQNPFINNDPNQSVNQAILTQWETWLDALESRGIVVNLVLYDDGADPYKTSTLSQSEKRYVDEIVNRFEQHANIIWSVAEEYKEAFAVYPGRISQTAAEIRLADDHDHLISVYHLKNDTTMDFPTDPNVNQFAMQSTASTPAGLYSAVRTAFQNLAGRWNIAMVENWNGAYLDHAWDLKTNNRVDARRRNWAVGMAGGYVLVVGSWENRGAPPPSAWLADWGNQAKFFEATNFHEMNPDSANKRGGTEYLLSKPGDSYIAYASNLVGRIGIGSLPAGTYRLTWLDIPSNVKVIETKIVSAGDAEFTRPAGIGTELAVYINRQPGGSSARVFLPLIRR